MADAASPERDYEARMVPALFRPWAERLVAAAGLQAGQALLDVGCGTGVVARFAAARLGEGATITALDRSPRMLEIAREVAARDRLSIDWHEGRAEQLPFADASFDRVLCQFALVYFDDRAQALRECARVLRPRGLLVLGVWDALDKDPFYSALDAALRRHAGVPPLGRAFALGDADALRGLVAGAGFAAVDVDAVSVDARFPDPQGFLAGEISLELGAIAALKGATPEQRAVVAASVAADMSEALAAVTDGDAVVLDTHALIVRARR